MARKMAENHALHLGTFVSRAKIILKPWPFFLALKVPMPDPAGAVNMCTGE